MDVAGIPVVVDAHLLRGRVYLIGQPYAEWARDQPVAERSVERWIAECVRRVT